MKYLKLFNDHSGYTEFCESGEMVRPNVSYCVEQNELHYNDVVMILTAMVNISNSGDYNVGLGGDWYFDLKVDGVSAEKAIVGWRPLNLSAGEHTVEYYFEKTNVCPQIYAVSNNPFYINITDIIIPEGIERIESVYNAQYGGYFPTITLGETYRFDLHIPNTLNYIGVEAICNGTGVVPTEEERTRLNNLCPLAPEQGSPYPWSAACGK